MAQKGPVLRKLTHEDINIIDTSELNQSKEEITENVEGPKGWTHEDMISQGG